MGDVVRFPGRETHSEPAADPEPTSTVSGPARCIACRHEYVAVAPAGISFFECPSCGCFKATFKGVCVPANSVVFVCHCGNDAFFVTPDGVLCCQCGNEPSPWSP